MIQRSDTTRLQLVFGNRRGVELNPPSLSIVELLLCLREGVDEREASEVASEQGPSVYYYLERLRRAGLLELDLYRDADLLATVVPRSKSFDPRFDLPSRNAWQLSRFAYLRRRERGLALESPESPCSVFIVGASLLDWIHEACSPSSAFQKSLKTTVMTWLMQFGFLVDPSEAEQPEQQTWEFHDHLFHAKSRVYHDLEPSGGTYRFRERFESEPALRPAYAGRIVDLPTQETRPSRSLLEVMESRRSLRKMGKREVTIRELGVLLHRVARTRTTLRRPLQDCLARPHPSAGAIYELEFYLAVGKCDGLSRGFYHYDGLHHRLTELPGATGPVENMLAHCARAWGQPDQPPQCLIVIGCRFPRIAWKYQSIAYRLSLLNAGVVLQSLYLICTDLGLAGAAAGAGLPDEFAKATGNSRWTEVSMAEFGLGAAPQTIL